MAIVLNDVVSNNNTSVINANFTKIEDAINDDLLKREIEVGEANEMRTHFDLNSNKAVNLIDGEDPQDATTLSQVETLFAAVPPGEDGEDGAPGYTPIKGVDYFDGDKGDTGATGPAGADGVVASVVAGTNVSVDATDPANPIISSTDTVPNKVDVSAFVSGIPGDSAKIITYVVSTAFTIPAGMTGSQAYAEVVPTAAATFTVSKNGGGSLGTINFALGANAATFTFVTPTAFAAGDRLQLVNQATADTTMADISVTVRGDL